MNGASVHLACVPCCKDRRARSRMCRCVLSARGVHVLWAYVISSLRCLQVSGGCKKESTHVRTSLLEHKLLKRWRETQKHRECRTWRRESSDRYISCRDTHASRTRAHCLLHHINSSSLCQQRELFIGTTLKRAAKARHQYSTQAGECHIRCVQY